LNTKYGCIGYLSEFPPVPLGLLLPFICKAIKWATTNAANTKGNKKCKEKNLFNVAFDTELYVDNYI